MSRIVLATLLVFTLLAPGAALADGDETHTTPTSTVSPTPTPTATSTSTPTATSTPEGNASRPTSLARVDRLTVITDYYLRGGNLVIEFYSKGGNQLAITETTTTDGATTVRVRRENIAAGKSRVVIDVIDRDDPSVLITTTLSLQQNTGTKVSVDTSESLIEGPYDGSDVRDAGIGGAVGVALAILYEAVRVKFAARNRGERVA